MVGLLHQVTDRAAITLLVLDNRHNLTVERALDEHFMLS
jgi:hypothetical protein